MQWFLVHTKPSQEKWALQNLAQQGYECYLPTFPREKVRQGSLTVTDEPLFPRYLFIRLGQASPVKSLAPIRSTKGVSRLVSFGLEPARIDDSLIEYLRAQEAARAVEPERLFNPGQRVRLTEGPFAGIEGIFQMTEGEQRVIVLIELLSRPVAMRVALADVRKVV